MSKNSVDSDGWTGGLPPPCKSPSVFQYRFTLAFGLVGVLYGFATLLGGLSTGRIDPPLRGLVRTVTTDDPVLFSLCILGWVIMILVLGTMVYWAASRLSNKLPR
jgi:hypothetical protein